MLRCPRSIPGREKKIISELCFLKCEFEHGDLGWLLAGLREIVTAIVKVTRLTNKLAGEARTKAGNDPNFWGFLYFLEEGDSSIKF